MNLVTFAWGRYNKYDGVKEYWVTVRESAQHTQSLETSETKSSKRKAPSRIIRPCVHVCSCFLASCYVLLYYIIYTVSQTHEALILQTSGG